MTTWIPILVANCSTIKSFRKDIKLAIKDIINYDQLVQIEKDKDLIINCVASTSHPIP